MFVLHHTYIKSKYFNNTMASFTNDKITRHYNITPKYKKCVREETIYSKFYDDLHIKLIVTKIWRYGKFEVELTTKEAEEIIVLDNVKLNDYSAMIESTDDLCEQHIMIHDLDKYPEHIQTKIQKDVYEDLEHDIMFDEGDLVDKYGWDLDDTIYSIDGGVVLTTNEDEDEDEDEDEIDDEEFKCNECGTVQGLNNCELCDAENVCEECYGQGGDYGPHEIWVCHDCLPVCLGCKSTLYSATDKCCGKGRSDISDDEDDEDDNKKQEATYYNVFRCIHCDASTSLDDNDCHICGKESCMKILQHVYTKDDNNEDEENKELEYTEEEIAYNKIDDVMFNKKCLNTDLKNKVALFDEEDDNQKSRDQPFQH